MVNVCSACGDPGIHLWQKKRYCQECYNELAFGIITNQNITFYGGGVATPEDDGGPWQQLAMKALEEGRE